MGLETPTFVSDLVTTNPVSGDVVSQGDDHLRNLKIAAKNTFPNADKAFYFPDSFNKTANYTVLAADMNKVITVDTTAGVVSLTLPTLASTDDGWQIWVVKTNAALTFAVTLVGTINGVSSLSFNGQHQAAKVWWSGTAWYAVLLASLPLALTNVSITGGTAETTPAVGDELPFYDLSALANRKMTFANFMKMLGLLTAETAPAVDDVVGIYDTSEAAANSMTLANLMKVINVLTEDATPDRAADFVMTYDTSASAVKKALLNSLSSGWQQIGAILSASSSTEIDFTATSHAAAFDGTYDEVMLLIQSLRPSADGARVFLRFGHGAGPSYAVTAYKYSMSRITSGGNDHIASVSDTILAISGAAGPGNDNGEHFEGELRFVSMDAVEGYSLCRFDMNFLDTSRNPVRMVGSGMTEAVEGVTTGLRILMSTGNIASGTFALYGLKKS